MKRVSKSGPTTADELKAGLEQDPSYIARLREDDRRQEENRICYRIAAEPVLQDLRDIGYEVETIGELVEKEYPARGPYKDAVPILMKWLPKVEYDALKEDIVRTLSVPWAKDAAPFLVSEFRCAGEGRGLRWVVGNALSVVATPAIFPDLVQLVRNREYGKDREMLALALAKVKTKESVDVLVELLEDEDLSGHALAALAKLKAAVPRKLVERFADHPKAWVRREASRLLKYSR